MTAVSPAPVGACRPSGRRPIRHYKPGEFARLLRQFRTSKIVESRRRFGSLILPVIGPMSQNELAKRAGIDTAHVSRSERGKRGPDGSVVVPSRSVVLSLASALELDPDDTDRLLFAGGYAPTRDWQGLALDALARLETIERALHGSGRPDWTDEVRAYPAE